MTVATLQLLAGLARHALAWWWATAPARFSYWLRPYSSHLDARCWRWQQPACRVHVFPAGDWPAAVGPM